MVVQELGAEDQRTERENLGAHVIDMRLFGGGGGLGWCVEGAAQAPCEGKA